MVAEVICRLTTLHTICDKAIALSEGKALTFGPGMRPVLDSANENVAGVSHVHPHTPLPSANLLSILFECLGKTAAPLPDGNRVRWN